MLVRFMFYFIFVGYMSCLCPFATISFRTSCHICADGLKKHFCFSHRARKVLRQVNVFISNRIFVYAYYNKRCACNCLIKINLNSATL